MGAVASSPCDKGSLVSDVKGITTRSASPSEQWFISIDSETLDSEPKSVFLKMFLSPNSNTKDLCDLTELPKRYNAISKDLTKVFRRGLNYELRMYKYVINNILESGMSASFIHAPYILEGCTFKNLVETLKRSSSGQTDDEIGERLKRNLLLTYSGNANIRPSINSIGWDDHFQLMDSVAGDKAKGMKTLCRYDALGLESFPSGHISLYKYCRELNNVESTTLSKAELKCSMSEVLFHVAAACYVMWTMGISQNDLHSENVEIVRLPVPELITYKYGGKSYTCKSGIRVLIFDFDRAWCDLLGKNILLEDTKACKISHQCNVQQMNRDFIYVAYEVYKYSKIQGVHLYDPQELINRVLPKDVRNTILMSQLTKQFLGTKYFNNKIDNNMRHLLYTPEDVLLRAAEQFNTDWKIVESIKGDRSRQLAPPVSFDETPVKHSKVMICDEQSVFQLKKRILDGIRMQNNKDSIKYFEMSDSARTPSQDTFISPLLRNPHQTARKYVDTMVKSRSPTRDEELASLFDNSSPSFGKPLDPRSGAYYSGFNNLKSIPSLKLSNDVGFEPFRDKMFDDLGIGEKDAPPPKYSTGSKVSTHPPYFTGVNTFKTPPPHGPSPSFQKYEKDGTPSNGVGFKPFRNKLFKNLGIDKKDVPPTTKLIDPLTKYRPSSKNSQPSTYYTGFNILKTPPPGNQSSDDDFNSFYGN